jgi:CubicO group peptidase (beta-lactamase class C family)
VVLRFLFCLTASILFICCMDQSDGTKVKINADTNQYINRDYLLKHLCAKDSGTIHYRLDTLFDRIAREQTINGNVLIAKGSTIVYKRSIGFADATTEAMLNDSSLFQLASVSKTLTAALILKLAFQNRLTLQDKITQYIPLWPYSEMTIHHLLCHRSGLKNYSHLISDSLKNKDKKYSNKSLVDFFIRHKPDLEFELDTKFYYCNTNYALLAYIAELAGKKPYYTLLKCNVLIPSGMGMTFLKDSIPSHQIKYLTRGHYHNFKTLEDDYFEHVYGDKGIYSTTTDMYRFSKALYAKVLFNQEWLNRMYQAYSPERKWVTYGYGWRMYSDSMQLPYKMVFHNGWWHGYRNAFHRRLDDETTIIILSNRLNRTVYHSWRFLDAMDGIMHKPSEDEEEKEE